MAQKKPSKSRKSAASHRGKKTASKKTGSKKASRKKSKSASKKNPSTSQKKKTRRKTSSKSSKPATAKRKTRRVSVDREKNERWDELSLQQKQAEEVLDNVALELLDHPDVTGATVDFKVSGGKIQRPLQYVIRIYVDVKKHRDDPDIKNRLLPEKIKGVATDVMSGRYRKCDGSSQQAQVFHQNPPGGCAIARQGQETDWGTMGIVVSFGDRKMYLTNEHVSGRAGVLIRQPPLPLEPIPPEEWDIGKVFRTGGASNRRVDCAIVEPLDSTERKPDERILGPDDGWLPGTITEGIATVGDENVFAIGAATGYEELRMGEVIKINDLVTFPDGSKLIRQIKVKSLDGNSLVERGDSGAILFRLEGTAEDPRNVIIGLVCGEFEEEDISGELIRGLIANHFRFVRKSLSFKQFT